MRNVLIALCLSLLTACSAAYHRTQVENSAHTLTAGVVQREIQRGMPQSAVAESLGAPNIVSRDESGRETWIYDRFATEASYSRSNAGGGFAGGVGGTAGSVLLLGIPAAVFNEDTGATATTQRSLTVVIKFDDHGRVDTATFHSSTF